MLRCIPKGSGTRQPPARRADVFISLDPANFQASAGMRKEPTLGHIAGMKLSGAVLVSQKSNKAAPQRLCLPTRSDFLAGTKPSEPIFADPRNLQFSRQGGAEPRVEVVRCAFFSRSFCYLS